ncbi:MAG: hypothetical protein QM756_45555 [Polyangiaceae bacterium]
MRFRSPLLQGANQVPPSPVVKSVRPARERSSIAPSSPPKSEAPPLQRATLSPPAQREPALGSKAKGINFTTVLAAVKELHGAEALERARAALPGDVGNALRYGGLVVGGWYPIEWYVELWNTLQAQLDLDEVKARAIGVCAARIGVNRVYRVFSRLASPSTLLRVAGAAFSSYFDTGEIRVSADGSKALIAEWSGCSGFNSLLWADSLGGAEYFLSATGVSEVKVHVLRGGGDQDWLVARGTWR